MNKITKILAVFVLFWVSACPISKSAEAEKSETATKILVSENSPAPTPVLKTETKLPQINESPRVWVGAIFLDNETLNGDGVWSGGDATPTDLPKSQGGLKLGTSYEVDVMNCAGFLGSAKVVFAKEGGFPPNWLLKFNTETIAADAKEKIKTCRKNSDASSSDAFAIAPQNAERRNIKIGKIDTKKLFASLSEDTQKWLKNKYASAVHKSGDLSLEEDHWTDIDGDGKIDLVFAFTNYDEEHSSGVIMMLVNGKWKDIGDVRD